ncbi:integrase catalytic domain-containing protein [Sphingopyxis granuli]|uniref:integrase catalytic domain-containing protein n=1 Tax=Sphingopyxis granuli TaxID=267128 RepID=UPI001BAFAC84|nr:DDE-type integrase/transposase/recombinase [Sphingopyxis granuli]QUM72217.1 DDE-type integrase/transposase/recombinase [Sphingopyxis granuli]
MSRDFKTDTSFVVALDVYARRGQPPILIVVDRGTSDYSIYELGDDMTGEIIAAIEQEIEAAGECPVAIETDNAICFSDDALHAWLEAKGIEHRYRQPAAIVEALIRQHSMNWGAK